jgi:hypothetical protein
VAHVAADDEEAAPWLEDDELAAAGDTSATTPEAGDEEGGGSPPVGSASLSTFIFSSLTLSVSLGRILSRTRGRNRLLLLNRLGIHGCVVT